MIPCPPFISDKSCRVAVSMSNMAVISLSQAITGGESATNMPRKYQTSWMSNHTDFLDLMSSVVPLPMCVCCWVVFLHEICYASKKHNKHLFLFFFLIFFVLKKKNQNAYIFCCCFLFPYSFTSWKKHLHLPQFFLYLSTNYQTHRIASLSN